MIDNFSLFVSHGLILLTCWRLLSRRDLDDETPPDRRGWIGGRRHDGPDRRGTGDGRDTQTGTDRPTDA